jgi:flavin-dependent dehydrogenase
VGAEAPWDVVVVGAGPAGCAAAAQVLLDRPSARVLIIDRSEFPRDKACGDGIAAEAFDELQRLGFDVSALVAGYPPLDRLRLRSPGGVDVDRRMRRQVRVIPRQVFDDRLLHQVVARGATFRRHTVRGFEAGPDGVCLDGQVTAKVVIGADGASSVVRRSLGAAARRSGDRATGRRSGDRATGRWSGDGATGRWSGDGSAGHVALAIRGYAPVPVGLEDAQLITMTDKRWPAYAWSFPTGDGWANVGYGELLTGKPLSRREMLSALHELVPGLETPQHLRGHRLPLSSGRPDVPDGRVLLAGDAQSLVNPLTGEGIFYAVVSGALAGRAAASGQGAGSAYRVLLRDRLEWHLRSASVVHTLGRWPGLVDVGMRSAARHRGAFDDLVRFGLADGGLTPRMLAGLLPSRLRNP